MRLAPRALAAAAAAAALALGAAACGGTDDAASTSTPAATVAQAAASGTATPTAVADAGTADTLTAVVQEAYGNGGLGLHRGHQDVQEVLTEVLGITHEELHVRMESQGQNLAAVATDLGIDPQVLVGALVDARATTIDALLQDGTITQDQADAYRAALESAYSFRVNWNGQDATPSFTGVA